MKEREEGILMTNTYNQNSKNKRHQKISTPGWAEVQQGKGCLGPVSHKLLQGQQQLSKTAKSKGGAIQFWHVWQHQHQGPGWLELLHSAQIFQSTPTPSSKRSLSTVHVWLGLFRGW